MSLRFVKNSVLFLIILPFSYAFGFSLGLNVLGFIKKLQIVQVVDGGGATPVAIGIFFSIPIAIQILLTRLLWVKK